ncbi:uncharacterized protein LOC134281099 [Saccostrea cucullata]|uniref:uncharacterized protein LOC134281099 n=1 Tax=Saccostrea cuccullata TaxID=36930 RepID=UPI002ED3D261
MHDKNDMINTHYLGLALRKTNLRLFQVWMFQTKDVDRVMPWLTSTVDEEAGDAPQHMSVTSTPPTDTLYVVGEAFLEKMAGISVLTSVVLFCCSLNVLAYDAQNEDKEPIRDLLEKLQERIFYQDERIFDLETKHTRLEKINVEQSWKIRELQNNSSDQERIISKLQSVCTRNIKTFGSNLGNLHHTVNKPFPNHSVSSHSFSKANTTSAGLFRKERLLVPVTSPAPTPSAGTTVAFYAYVSHKLASPGSHIVIAFDTVITNIGNGYHPHSGIFIAPRTGTYVFTWSFRIQNDAHLSTELIVNEKAISAVFFDATNGVGGNSAGTAVAQLNQNDEVFVRITTSNNLGDILSDVIGRSYYGGWMID